jgi:hypothetical protein
MTKSLLAGLICMVFSLNSMAEDAKTTEKKAGTQTEKSIAQENAAQKDEEQPNTTVRLESVFVGDKEQPAISYFIPWQGIGTPDKLYWNVEEKHDKALNLVDRDIMLRSIHFYQEMQLETPEATAKLTD